MKNIGIVLIIIGILMVVFTRIDFTTKEKVIDAGPIEINKEEEHSVDWPTYTGIGVAILGAILLVGAGRKKA